MVEHDFPTESAVTWGEFPHVQTQHVMFSRLL